MSPFELRVPLRRILCIIATFLKWNGHVSHEYQRPALNFRHNGNFREDTLHCVPYEIFREIFFEFHLENFDHKFCNCGRVVEHVEHKLDGFGEYIWKIERLRHSVHRFWFPWVFGVLGDSLSVPEKIREITGWKTRNLLSLKKFRGINSIATSLVKTMLSRNFCQKL